MTRKRKILIILLVAFVVSAILRTFVVEPFLVIGDSMEPTIQSGDYVFINKLAYVFKEPQRGDIVIALSREFKQRVIKRIIGLPGERFSIENGRVMIRVKRTDVGVELEERYLTSIDTPSTGIVKINLDPKEYFALGDNRAVSIDSRELGPIDVWDIKGKAFASISLKNLKIRVFSK